MESPQIICDEAAGESNFQQMLNIFTQQHLHKIANLYCTMPGNVFLLARLVLISFTNYRIIHIAMFTVMRLV